ncbi:efflux RND transporter periplasmic adaptor subunit [Thalassospiraceae bacterium LMO-SO8]|nr:efflux RND transporter periplasmic adaptor subunit [Alphaproteobacteria bacterium LMO-S08]WND77040.1 efflux RND transporter periplasmic adaptor subunit [Thalassospiraceae bacterium LMO-SO8]|tara:strand:- start:12311 stop:13300 length:990 start_codon:yes stop_codon:yes gene_type:complete
MKRWQRAALMVSAIVVVAVAAAVSWKYYGDPHENSGHLVLLGNVDVRQVNLAFKVPGRLATMTAEEGDAVEARQTVASLESEDFEDELRLARARVQGQEAALAELETGTRPEEVEQARALVRQREAALQLARATLDRQEKLAARNVASHQVHDEAQARLDEARAQLSAAKEALELAVTGPRQEDIDQARAQLSADRAALSLAERRLADATLTAPNDGIILTRVREPGAIVAAGETIYTLTLTSPVWVRTYVDEPDLGRIHAGMPAEVHTDSGGTYEGRIGFISPVAEFTPKTVETRELRTSLVYRLRVIVENSDNGLKQGMPVTVVLKV